MADAANENASFVGVLIATLDTLIDSAEKRGFTEEVSILDRALKRVWECERKRRVEALKVQLEQEGPPLDQNDIEFIDIVSRATPEQKAKILDLTKVATKKPTH